MADDRLSVTLLGTYQTGVFDESAAEIADYNPINQQVVFTNADTGTVIILDASDPTNPTFVSEVGPPDLFESGGVNSVAFFSNGNFIVCFEGEDADDNGIYATYLASGAFAVSGPTGALPDMITTDPGTTGNNQIIAITANEGEPDDDYMVDPLGSVTLIRIDTEVTLDFTSFNSQEEALKAQGLRIFGPGATLAQDLEPEFVTVAGDSAYVICQENNGFAIVDLNTETIVDIIPFGFKDHACAANALDASNDDDAINLANYDVLGMYQPDAAIAYQVDGATYLLTANEGDARDYDGFSEEVRVRDLMLDPTAYPDAATLQQDEVLGRLRVTDALGDTDGDGDFDQLYSYGARSFSIFAVDGTLIWDSGSEFERILAEVLPDHFNSNNDDNDSFDSRSDDKGPEPEAITLGTIGERTYAFIGLERVGGVMIYDVTDPTAPFFVNYFNNRNFDVDAELEDDGSNPEAGDLGVEDITFVSAADSPNGQPMLIIANEVSGTVSFFQLGGDLVSTPTVAPAEMAFSAFPNPTSDQLNLQFDLPQSGRISYSLLDLHGRVVDQADLGLRSAGEQRETIQLAGLPAGTYLLRLTTEQAVSSLRVMKQ